MRIVAHGIDIVECSRVAELMERHGDRFLHRVFTPGELGYALHRKRCVEHLAGRFAAKEAVLKVLGTGWSNGISWRDVEVWNEGSGKPRLRLSGKVRQLADEQRLAEIILSISHCPCHAIASAIAVQEASGGALGIGD